MRWREIAAKSSDGSFEGVAAGAGAGATVVTTALVGAGAGELGRALHRRDVEILLPVRFARPARPDEITAGALELEHRPVDRPASGVQHRFEPIGAEEIVRLGHEHAHPVLRVVTVVRREVDMGLSVQNMELGRPDVFRHRPARRRSPHPSRRSRAQRREIVRHPQKNALRRRLAVVVAPEMVGHLRVLGRRPKQRIGEHPGLGRASWRGWRRRGRRAGEAAKTEGYHERKKNARPPPQADFPKHRHGWAHGRIHPEFPGAYHPKSPPKNDPQANHAGVSFQGDSPR